MKICFRSIQQLMHILANWNFKLKNGQKIKSLTFSEIHAKNLQGQTWNANQFSSIKTDDNFLPFPTHKPYQKHFAPSSGCFQTDS